MGFYLFTLLKLTIGFVIVISYMNYMGKTQLSQMTPVDFIGNFILGGIVGGVIYNDSIPFYQYIIMLFLGIGLISLFNHLSKNFDFFRKVTIGTPIVIIKDGAFVMQSILEKSNKIDIINVSSILHAQGVHSFQEVRYAQIEPNGQITVIKKDEPLPSVIVMKSGQVMASELEKIEKDEDWLDRQLLQQNIQKKEHVFLAEFWEDKITFVLEGGNIKPDDALPE